MYSHNSLNRPIEQRSKVKELLLSTAEKYRSENLNQEQATLYNNNQNALTNNDRTNNNNNNNNNSSSSSSNNNNNNSNNNYNRFNVGDNNNSNSFKYNVNSRNSVINNTFEYNDNNRMYYKQERPRSSSLDINSYEYGNRSSNYVSDNTHNTNNNNNNSKNDLYTTTCNSQPDMSHCIIQHDSTDKQQQHRLNSYSLDSIPLAQKVFINSNNNNSNDNNHNQHYPRATRSHSNNFYSHQINNSELSSYNSPYSSTETVNPINDNNLGIINRNNSTIYSYNQGNTNHTNHYVRTTNHPKLNTVNKETKLESRMPGANTIVNSNSSIHYNFANVHYIYGHNNSNVINHHSNHNNNNSNYYGGDSNFESQEIVNANTRTMVMSTDVNGSTNSNRNNNTNEYLKY
eukprot:Pgem_evm1s3588